MARKQRPKEDTAYLTEADRLAIEARRKEKGLSLARLSVECGASDAALTLLLSRPIPPGRTRGCRFLSRLQAALDLAPTARRPNVVPAEHQRRAERIIAEIGSDQELLEAWFAVGEVQARRSKK